MRQARLVALDADARVHLAAQGLPLGGIGGRVRTRIRRLGAEIDGRRHAGEIGPHVARDAFGIHDRFEQRIAGQAIRAVHAGRRDLAAGVQARHGRLAVEIDGDAAHVVMGRGDDRNEIDARVEPVQRAGRENRREVFGQFVTERTRLREPMGSIMW